MSKLGIITGGGGGAAVRGAAGIGTDGGKGTPIVGTTYRVNLFWMGRSPMIRGKRYKLKAATAEALRVQGLTAAAEKEAPCRESSTI